MRPNIYQRGVVSIEFALGFMALWLLTIAMMDLGLRNYSTSVVNFAVSETSRDMKVLSLDSEKAFSEHFLKIIEQNSFSLWGILTRKDSLDVKIKYYASVKDLADENYKTSVQSPKKFPIARYEITYQYQPFLGVSMVPNAAPIHRSVIAVQEGARNG